MGTLLAAAWTQGAESANFAAGTKSDPREAPVATKRRVRQLTILMVASALLVTAAGPAGGQAGASARPGREARGVAVTLLTGDKVILRQLPGERRRST
jgi:hypothetical protein